MLLVASPAAAQDIGHSYVLRARLDPEHHVVEGRARIRWRNGSRVAVSELWLHLYPNAFESDETVFMRESAGELRGVAATTRGSMEVESLALAGSRGGDLLAGSDDEVIPGDRTQLRVPLPFPVLPGQSVTLVTRFRTTLPEVFARSGYSGSFHAVAQWFPKLARLEPDGTWASFPYHGNGEFYADFARYELTVDAPASFVVGATGELVEERVDNGRAIRTYRAEPVSDAVFVASDDLLEETFESSGTRVRILYPPGYEAALARHRLATEHGLARYGRLFGAYPYPTLTVVVPPEGAEGAAGMEYPTLFFTAGPWFRIAGLDPILEDDVTLHELAHQWFQHMVGTNEVQWPMLDEGLTEWSSTDALRALHGPRASAMSFPLPVDYFEILRRFDYAPQGGATPPPGLPAYAYDSDGYGRAVYARTCNVLETIGRTFGARPLERALGLYAREQRFRHPTPDDLYAAFDRVYWPGFAAALLEPALIDGEDAELALTRFDDRREGDAWVTEVAARRIGALPLPTWVELVDEDGGRTRIPFRGSERSLRVTHRSAKRIALARVDPDGHDLLDPNVRDDVRARVRRHGGAPFAYVLFLVQELLALVGP